MSNTASRANVGLTEKSTFALRYLTNKLEMSQTDVINRALQLYQFIETNKDDGKTLALRDGDKYADMEIL